MCNAQFVFFYLTKTSEPFKEKKKNFGFVQQQSFARLEIQY